MNRIALIAAEEWRSWCRSRLAAVVLLLMAALVVTSAALTAQRVQVEAGERRRLQETAETTFESQPDRHPHRMVHYGHYVFRSPPPLARVDPGVDAFTGTSLFLEGHRQNSAGFAGARETASLARMGSLSPAFVLQVLWPLLLILLGYATLTREREGGTLLQLRVQGASPLSLLAGKGLALASVGLVSLLPLFVGVAWAVAQGESVGLAAWFTGGYLAYLLCWVGVILLVSTLARSATSSLGALIGAWIVLALLVPRLAATAAQAQFPAPGNLETEFAALDALRAVGDGHNAADPAFDPLIDRLLAEYEVERVEDLPVNIRGVVAEASEAELTAVLDRFAEERMAREADQARAARGFGWLSPVLAVRSFSMTAAGTDLAMHHRFLREAEAVRIDFVQALNRVHAEQLAYSDDVRRGSDAAAERRTRVSAENWSVLREFRFEPASAAERRRAGAGALAMLLAWLCALAAAIGTLAARRLEA